jgi:hypothetical protein
LTNLIENYLEDLDRALGNRVPDAVRLNRVAEMRGHLHLSVRDLMANGHSEDDAIEKAVRQLGSARDVAYQFIRQHRGPSRRSAWTLSIWAFGFVLLANALGFFLRSVPSLYIQWDLVRDCSWVPMFALFGWFVWRSRRWLVLPVSAFTLLAAVVPAIVFHFTDCPVACDRSGFRYSPPSERMGVRGFYLTEVALSQQTLDRSRKTYADVLRGGHAPFFGEDAFVPQVSSEANAPWVPGKVISVQLAENRAYFVGEELGLTQAEADQRWRDYGVSAISAVKDSIVDLKKYRGESHFSESTRDFLLRLILIVGTVTVNAVFLVAVNWGVLRMAELRQFSMRERLAS